MARRRYQTGSLLIRGKRRKVWVARWREDVIRPDGSLGRVMRSEVLGLVSEIPTRREARKLLETRLRPINNGRHRPESTIPLERFAREHWEPVVGESLRHGTRRFYGIALRNHVLPAFGKKALGELHREEIQAFLVEKRRSGLSPSTVHGIRNALSKVLGTAVEWGYLEHNPASGIRLGDREPLRERLYLAPPEVHRLLAALPEPCRTLVLLAVLTGLRIGELLALRWKSLDLVRGVVMVRETVSEGCFGAPKTRSSRRDVPLSEAALNAVLFHRGRCRQAQPEDLLFASRNQTPLNPKNLMRRVLRPACKALELPPITWHSFRHTHATLLGEVGESLRTAQAILGHSDLKTTLNVYTHPIPESERRAVDKVAAILFPNVPKFGNSPENGKPVVQ